MVDSRINRYYDPSTDQFLSVDPDVATTEQPYAFTNDDPLNAEDPFGDDPALVYTAAQIAQFHVHSETVAAETQALVIQTSITTYVQTAQRNLNALQDEYGSDLANYSYATLGAIDKFNTFFVNTFNKLAGLNSYLASVSYAAYNLYTAAKSSIADTAEADELAESAQLALGTYEEATATAAADYAAGTAAASAFNWVNAGIDLGKAVLDFE